MILKEEISQIRGKKERDKRPDISRTSENAVLGPNGVLHGRRANQSKHEGGSPKRVELKLLLNTTSGGGCCVGGGETTLRAWIGPIYLKRGEKKLRSDSSVERPRRNEDEKWWPLLGCNLLEGRPPAGRFNCSATSFPEELGVKRGDGPELGTVDWATWGKKKELGYGDEEITISCLLNAVRDQPMVGKANYGRETFSGSNAGKGKG